MRQQSGILYLLCGSFGLNFSKTRDVGLLGDSTVHRAYVDHEITHGPLPNQQFHFIETKAAFGTEDSGEPHTKVSS